MAETHVLIFAEAALHREAWRALLSGQPGIRLAGVASDLAAVTSLPAGQPGAGPVDQPPPRPDLVRRLKASVSDCGLLLLVDNFDLGEVIPLLQAGATGCISRDSPVGDLARGIIAAGRGEIVLPPAIAGRAPAGGVRGEPLSDREAEVLRLLAQGLTNKDMAQTLILSVRTVEAHLRSIYGKLGARSRTEAALWAVKHGHGRPE